MAIQIRLDIAVTSTRRSDPHMFYFDDKCGTELSVMETNVERAFKKAKADYSRIKQTNYGILYLTRVSRMTKNHNFQG